MSIYRQDKVNQGARINKLEKTQNDSSLEFSSLESRVATNQTDIATNQTDIATNQTDIATNQTDIAMKLTSNGGTFIVPTVDPLVSGALWNDAGTLSISA